MQKKENDISCGGDRYGCYKCDRCLYVNNKGNTKSQPHLPSCFIRCLPAFTGTSGLGVHMWRMTGLRNVTYDVTFWRCRSALGDRAETQKEKKKEGKSHTRSKQHG